MELFGFSRKVSGTNVDGRKERHQNFSIDPDLRPKRCPETYSTKIPLLPGVRVMVSVQRVTEAMDS